MNNPRYYGTIKWQLLEYECDNCDLGVVQVLKVHGKKTITDNVSGCLNCKKSFGLLQADKLNKLEL